MAIECSAICKLRRESRRLCNRHLNLAAPLSLSNRQIVSYGCPLDYEAFCRCGVAGLISAGPGGAYENYSTGNIPAFIGLQSLDDLERIFLRLALLEQLNDNPTSGLAHLLAN
jgi:hypothetical protein